MFIPGNLSVAIRLEVFLLNPLRGSFHLLNSTFFHLVRFSVTVLISYSSRQGDHLFKALKDCSCKII